VAGYEKEGQKETGENRGGIKKTGKGGPLRVSGNKRGARSGDCLEEEGAPGLEKRPKLVTRRRKKRPRCSPPFIKDTGSLQEQREGEAGKTRLELSA